MGKKKVTDGEIIEILADPKYKTRQDQADVLGIARESLWERLKKKPKIITRVKELVDEGTANTVAKGFNRLDRIIDGGRDGDAIKALRHILDYRGEIATKLIHEGGDNPINIIVQVEDAKLIKGLVSED